MILSGSTPMGCESVCFTELHSWFLTVWTLQGQGSTKKLRLSLHQAKWCKPPQLIPVFAALDDREWFYSDGMQVCLFHRTTQLIFSSVNPTRARFNKEAKVKSAPGQVMQTTTAYPSLCCIRWSWVVLLWWDASLSVSQNYTVDF